MSQESCRLFHVLAIGSNQIKSNQSLKFTWVITNSWIFNTSVKSSNTSVTFQSKKITGNNCWLLSDWINSNLWNDWSLNEFLKGSAHLLQVWAKFSEIYQMDRFFNQMPHENEDLTWNWRKSKDHLIASSLPFYLHFTCNLPFIHL